MQANSHLRFVSSTRSPVERTLRLPPSQVNEQYSHTLPPAHSGNKTNARVSYTKLHAVMTAALRWTGRNVEIYFFFGKVFRTEKPLVSDGGV